MAKIKVETDDGVEVVVIDPQDSRDWTLIINEIMDAAGRAFETEEEREQK